jgi:hypothetical protein
MICPCMSPATGCPDSGSWLWASLFVYQIYPNLDSTNFEDRRWWGYKYDISTDSTLLCPPPVRFLEATYRVYIDNGYHFSSAYRNRQHVSSHSVLWKGRLRSGFRRFGVAFVGVIVCAAWGYSLGWMCPALTMSPPQAMGCRLSPNVLLFQSLSTRLVVHQTFGTFKRCIAFVILFTSTKVIVTMIFDTIHQILITHTGKSQKPFDIIKLNILQCISISSPITRILKPWGIWYGQFVKFVPFTHAHSDDRSINVESQGYWPYLLLMTFSYQLEVVFNVGSEDSTCTTGIPNYSIQGGHQPIGTRVSHIDAGNNISEATSM